MFVLLWINECVSHICCKTNMPSHQITLRRYAANADKRNSTLRSSVHLVYSQTGKPIESHKITVKSHYIIVGQYFRLYVIFWHIFQEIEVSLWTALSDFFKSHVAKFLALIMASDWGKMGVKLMKLRESKTSVRKLNK